MTVNIYDSANQLEQDLRKTDEYQNLNKAFTALQNDPEAKQLYEEFRQIQQTLQQKQQSGQEITEEESQQAQEISTKVGENEILANLIESEKQLSEVIEEVNKIAMKPVQDLYQQQGQ